LKIQIHYHETNFRIKRSKKLKDIIIRVIRKESKIPGDLSFIFVPDEYLIEINREFLEHNYYTDVIAFPYNQGTIINGEVYISIETVRRNANNYKVSLNNEVARVLIHATLHLCGYEDNTKRKRMQMMNLEDEWLERLK
jgi:rRNA maturation RNase YbeY